MELTQGVKFRVLPSVKFKDIGIYIRFIHPLTPQFATKVLADGADDDGPLRGLSHQAGDEPPQR